MGSNLAKIFKNLEQEKNNSNCSVCKTISAMDKETQDAFIDVMKSTVTIKSIVDALTDEGVTISRYQLGEVRRECINGVKQCSMFKGDKK